MQHSKEIADILVCIITALVQLLYATQIWRARTQEPPQGSWILWTCAMVFLTVSTGMQYGWFSTTNLFFIVSAIGHVCITTLVLIYGKLTWSREEKIIGGIKITIDDKRLFYVGIGTFILWVVAYIAEFPYAGLLLALQLSTDFIGAIIYIDKIWRNPDDEPLYVWSINTAIYPLFLLGTYWGMQHWSEIIIPLYALIVFGPFPLYILLARKRKKYNASV